MAIDIRDRLKQIREALKMSQKELASAFGGVPVSAISKYERGEVKPSFEMIAKYGSIGVDVNWLLTGQGSMFLCDHRVSQTSDISEPLDGEVAEAINVIKNDVMAQKIAIMLQGVDEEGRREILANAEKIKQAAEERARLLELGAQVEVLKGLVGKRAG